ncbi:hypothetical protein IHQ71_30180 (plasmid) [Rhizobium sp. TH2]|uniref:hypothetical protein n=1 Tax=Rhizobium sp. TH2 TaxID=2775403 RepID=UPI00215729B8|nr:hypothetical protein [Rhizobium sp. TH2]UVC12509.1 hypothetical protein IHQ71_30180 [Rhizobium sp. TH2]
MKDELRAYTCGPTFMAGGGTRFRLWAPAEKAVALRIGGRDISMNRMDDGWHQAEIDTQPFGQDYIFVLSDGLTVPDPASWWQIDVLGPSILIDPNQYRWTHETWQGRPRLL